ncbi:MAG: RES family NAD+ phosphorylase [Thermoanaerobacteraceae bacterium]|nr:RES family NAD+ phosphorylase [Thermoanaerobacteraceae bacterium]
MIRNDRLAQTLTGIQPVPFTGICYRVIDMKYVLQGDHILSGKGAYLASGRFHRKGDFPCVYLGESIATVTQEVIEPPIFPPKVLVSVSIRVHNLLDLTDEKVLDELDTTIQEMTGRWEKSYNLGKVPSTQILGKVAYDSGRFEGIIYYSCKTNYLAKNLVLFTDKLVNGSYITLHDPDQLIGKKYRKKVNDKFIPG